MTDFKGLKVAELKDELTARGLSTKGLKKELLDRLEEAEAAGTAGGQKPVEEETDGGGEKQTPSRTPGTDTANGHAEPAPETQDAKVEASEPVPAPKPETAVKEAETKAELPAMRHNLPADKEVVVEVPSTDKPVEIQVDVEMDGKDVKVADVKVDDAGKVEVAKTGTAEAQNIEIEMEIEDEEPAAAPTDAAQEPVKAAKPEEPVRAVEMTPEKAAGASTAEVPAEPSNAAAVGDKRKREDGMDVDEDIVPAAEAKRPRASKERPNGLSHTIHPPTSSLYITNLRRPLLQPQLIEYLTSFAPLSTGALPSLPDGVWIDGVKSHCYALFQTVEDATSAAQKIHGVKWPEDMGQDLHVEFVETEQVERLVTQEKVAWVNGRAKLSLKIEETDEGFKFNLGPAGPATLRQSAPDRQLPLATGLPMRGAMGPVATGVNAIRPAGPVRAPPPHMAGGPPMPVVRRTRTRPVLTWNEGPGAPPSSGPGPGGREPFRSRAPLPPQAGPPQNGWGRRGGGGGGGGGFGGGRDGGIGGGGRGGRGDFQRRDRW